MKPSLQAVLLRTTGALGLILFAIFFSFTYAIPEYVETFAAEFIEYQVTKKTNETIDKAKPPPGKGRLGKLAERLYAQNEQKIEELKNNLREKVHETMAGALAEIRDLDCECRERWAQFFKQGFEFEITTLQTANDKVVDFIHSKYMSTAESLKRDIRIFTASNAVMFLLMLGVSFLKPRAMSHLSVPAALMMISTLICAYFYVFEQNWLLTIIYNDYLGFAYLGYLLIVFLFLCDIVLNRARVTTEIVNTIADALGLAGSLAPC